MDRLSEATFEFLFQAELRAMWRAIGEVLGYPNGWRG